MSSIFDGTSFAGTNGRHPPPPPPPLDEAAQALKNAAYEAAGFLIQERTSAAHLLATDLPPEECLLGSLVTRTSRVFLVGSTGTGKTMLGLAIAGGMSSGDGFLHWRSCRPARVLYIDGEMSLRALQARVRDLARRMGGVDAVGRLHLLSWQEADAIGVGEWAPLSLAAGQQYVLALVKLVQPDVIIFDNVQALLAGDMKDEVPWNDTWPLIAALTALNIGQVWIDHTGHDTSRQYGTSTKAWKFDTVAILTPLPREERAPGETAFKLSFDAPGKCRNREPSNWAEYDPTVIRLRDDCWTGEPAEGGARQANLPPSRAVFHEALTAAITRAGTGGAGETTREAWEGECIRRGLIEAAGAELRDGPRRMPLRRAQAELIAARWIAVDGERVIDLKHRWT